MTYKRIETIFGDAKLASFHQTRLGKGMDATKGDSKLIILAFLSLSWRFSHYLSVPH